MTATQPEGEPTTDGDVGRYQCPACPARFESMGEKRKHMRDERGHGDHR